MTKTPMTRWTIQVTVSEDGFTVHHNGVWATSLAHSVEVANEFYGLLHRDSSCRCSSHTCVRCADKGIGEKVIEEHEG